VEVDWQSLDITPAIYAWIRICHKLELLLPKKIYLSSLMGIFYQELDYEGLPLHCYAYHMAEHLASSCRKQEKFSLKNLVVIQV